MATLFKRLNQGEINREVKRSTELCRPSETFDVLFSDVSITKILRLAQNGMLLREINFSGFETKMRFHR